MNILCSNSASCSSTNTLGDNEQEWELKAVCVMCPGSILRISHNILTYMLQALIRRYKHFYYNLKLWERHLYVVTLSAKFVWRSSSECFPMITE
jgi:hypothetical protein